MPSENAPIKYDERAKEARNPYYLRIAGVYRLLKWGTLLLLTVYLAFMLARHRESITYDNLLYLIRDLNIFTSADGGFSAVSYEEQQNMLFGSFQNNLAVVGSSGIHLYDGAGNCILSDSLSYKTPVLETGEKYLLLYDAGGREYALFTTLACVMRGTTEHTLQYAAVSESGAYCTVTRSDETKYKVTLYNAAFMEAASYYLDSYVTAAAVHPSGKAAAVLTVSSQNWSLAAGVSFYSSESRDVRTVSLGDSLPVSARYLANGTLAVICDDSIVYLNEEGVMTARISLGSSVPDCFSVSENKVAMVCRENVLGSVSRILVLDSAGHTLFDEIRTDKVSSVTASSGENAAYIVYGNTVEAVSVLGSKTYSGKGHLHAVREVGASAVLCFADGAYSLRDLDAAE